MTENLLLWLKILKFELSIATLQSLISDDHLDKVIITLTSNDQIASLQSCQRLQTGNRKLKLLNF